MNLTENGLTLAGREAPLTLTVSDGGTDASSGAFVRFSKLDGNRCALQCGGLEDYPAVRLDFDNEDAAWWYFSETESGGTAFPDQEEPWDDTLPETTCTLTGYDQYALDGTKMSCLATRLIVDQTVVPAP